MFSLIHVRNIVMERIFALSKYCLLSAEMFEYSMLLKYEYYIIIHHTSSWFPWTPKL